GVARARIELERAGDVGPVVRVRERHGDPAAVAAGRDAGAQERDPEGDLLQAVDDAVAVAVLEGLIGEVKALRGEDRPGKQQEKTQAETWNRSSTHGVSSLLPQLEIGRHEDEELQSGRHADDRFDLRGLTHDVGRGARQLSGDRGGRDLAVGSRSSEGRALLRLAELRDRTDGRQEQGTPEGAPDARVDLSPKPARTVSPEIG